MKSKLIIAITILGIGYPSTLTRGMAAAEPRAVGSPKSAQTALFSAADLDSLLSPIALYPDPLLAQVLPAATFVDQIIQAARWVGANHNLAGINNQPWDSSVKAIAGFPDVLSMMNSQLDWTTAVGQAYVAQFNDVSASIQRLRQQARASGALVSTPQQIVAVQQGFITILPAQPTMIFVPQYNPTYVWGPSTGAVVASSLLSFGTGVALGSWWNPGWNRGWGWGGGGIFNINNTAININRNIMNRRFNRGNLGWFRHGRPGPGRPGPGRPGGAVNLPGRPNRPGAPGANRPNIPGTPNRPGTPGANRPNIPGTPNRPGRPGANRPTNPETPNRPGTPGANRPSTPETPNRPGTPGMGGNRPSTSGGRPGSSVSRPSGGHGGGGRARHHGGHRHSGQRGGGGRSR